MYVGTRMRPVTDVIADAMDTDNPSVAFDFMDHLLNFALDCPREQRLYIRNVCNKIRSRHGRRQFLAAPTSEANQPATTQLYNDKVPACLRTCEAEELWLKLREAGFIKPDSYALAEGVSDNQATYIAAVMASALKLQHKWKPFIELWNIVNMPQLAHNWQETGRMPKDYKLIDKLLDE